MPKVKIMITTREGESYSVEDDTSVDRESDSPYGPKKTAFSVAMQAVTLLYNADSSVARNTVPLDWTVEVDTDGKTTVTKGSSDAWWMTERDIAKAVTF